jgi:CubicO group peptidase (beta-lactamase class C family)
MIKKINLALYTLLFILVAYMARAQQQAYISISGKITDAENHQPIHGVSISIDRKGVGTATNIDGKFALMIPVANFKDTLKVSCIGFKTKYLSIVNLKSGDEHNITLEKNSTQLKEVSVAYHDPLKIIQKAIARIPDNYINHPHITRGFYRMYTSDGKVPLQLSEAVFDVYNFGYGDKRADLFRLIKARDEKNERDFSSIELGQKPNSVFEDDLVNHLYTSGFLSDRGIKKHKYEVMGIVDVKGYEAYEIDFKEKSADDDETFRGRMFIDTQTYAFIDFDFGLSPSGLSHFMFGNFAKRVLMGIAGVKVEMKRDRSKVSYQKVGDRWVLAGVTSDNALYIKSPGLKYDFTANVKFNYQVTAVDTVQTASFNTKIGRGENINDHDSNDGEEFWKDYNILLADYKTEDIFKQIKAINGLGKLKGKFEDKARKLPKDPAIRLDSLLSFYHANGQFNGTALIKSKGAVILSKSYGYADKEKQTEANSHTTYRIGSTSKTFTSVIINQLVSEGKLYIDTPIKYYIPYYKHGGVTIGQLLTHQSGIPEYFTNDDYKVQIITKSFSLKDMVAKFCSDPLDFESGTEFEYSNANFEVLALIAQEVTGKPFETLLQERIFTPLKMTDTYFGNDKGSNNHQAKGYSENAPELIYDVANEAGAGGISSSAEDLLKYHDALLYNQLLSKEAKAQMLKTRVEFKDYDAWYDYGWMTDKKAFSASGKHVITYHPGTDLGFFTMFARQEDADNCIILLNNTGDFPRYDLTDLILDILNPQK